mmetsp:Transcript_26484/g.67337  ORF Transcript_26484/g.67337 Transcript_26484/m.67337 type:complete len:240 (+) Transcript_26484:1320-2039(+)
MRRACTSASVRVSMGRSASAPPPLRPTCSPSTSCFRMSTSSHSSSMSCSVMMGGRSASYSSVHSGSVSGAKCSGALLPSDGKNCSNSCASIWHTRSRCSQPARVNAGSGCAACSWCRRWERKGETSCWRAAAYSAMHSSSSRMYSGREVRDSTSLTRPLRFGSAAALKRTYSSDTSVPSASTGTCCAAAAALAAVWPAGLGTASWMAACTCTTACFMTCCTLLRTAPSARACSCLNFVV